MIKIGDRVVMRERENSSNDHRILIPNGAQGTVVELESLLVVAWDESYEAWGYRTYNEYCVDNYYPNVWRVPENTVALIYESNSEVLPNKHQKVINKIKTLSTKKVPLRKVKVLSFPDKKEKVPVTVNNYSIDSVTRTRDQLSNSTRYTITTSPFCIPTTTILDQDYLNQQLGSL